MKHKNNGKTFAQSNPSPALCLTRSTCNIIC